MLFATTPVAAEIYGDGEAAYSAGNYQKAFRLWKPLAEREVAKAQRRLGQMYWVGWGVTKYVVHAYAWWSIAAAQENAYNTLAKKNTPKI
ncbi:MAG: hypothetical protein VCE75_00025 [Alphaproteobacteria bacterium]